MVDWRQRKNSVLQTLDQVRCNCTNASTDGIRRVAEAPWQDRWPEAVRGFENLMKAGLKAQSDLGTTALDQATDLVPMPRTARDVSNRLVEMLQDFTVTEAGLLANTADLVRHLDPVRLSGLVRHRSRRPLRQMQAMTKETIETQLDHMRGWTRES